MLNYNSHDLRSLAMLGGSWSLNIGRAPEDAYGEGVGTYGLLDVVRLQTPVIPSQPRQWRALCSKADSFPSVALSSCVSVIVKTSTPMLQQQVLLSAQPTRWE